MEPVKPLSWWPVQMGLMLDQVCGLGFRAIPALSCHPNTRMCSVCRAASAFFTACVPTVILTPLLSHSIRFTHPKLDADKHLLWYPGDGQGKESSTHAPTHAFIPCNITHHLSHQAPLPFPKTGSHTHLQPPHPSGETEQGLHFTGKTQAMWPWSQPVSEAINAPWKWQTHQ